MRGNFKHHNPPSNMNPSRWGYFSLSNPGGCLTYTFSSNTPFKKALFTSIWYNLNPLATEKASKILIATKRATGAKVFS
jgi:hypothetical protein